jgi:hypothetical protein
MFRSQTTKGIWLALAKAKNIEPCALVMDLEGTDGRERGEVIQMSIPPIWTWFECVSTRSQKPNHTLIIAAAG